MKAPIMNKPITAAITATLATTALAGPAYQITWSTIDSGGGTSNAGAFTLSGTIGQPDASPALTGGVYTLTGGFWPAINAASPACNDADLAEPYAVLDLADINTFIAGFVTQQPIADINTDGIYDLADINAFIAAFTTGCP